ncbi:hypothetical protein VNO77_19356 [Canavalia gladiata]|uniref:Uncharacterized protein n=1 Tax=Canavalia gladiata TaxID=3824 RepID=A0AAN9LN75_CANGL
MISTLELLSFKDPALYLALRFNPGLEALISWKTEPLLLKEILVPWREVRDKSNSNRSVGYRSWSHLGHKRYWIDYLKSFQFYELGMTIKGFRSLGSEHRYLVVFGYEHQQQLT